MTHDLKQLEQLARQEAMALSHPYIRSEHLLLALAKMDAGAVPVSYDALFSRLDKLAKPGCGAEQTLTLAAGAKRALEKADNDLAASIIASSPLLRRLISEIQEAKNAPAN